RTARRSRAGKALPDGETALRDRGKWTREIRLGHRALRQFFQADLVRERCDPGHQDRQTMSYEENHITVVVGAVPPQPGTSANGIYTREEVGRRTPFLLTRTTL